MFQIIISIPRSLNNKRNLFAVMLFILITFMSMIIMFLILLFISCTFWLIDFLVYISLFSYINRLLMVIKGRIDKSGKLLLLFNIIYKPDPKQIHHVIRNHSFSRIEILITVNVYCKILILWCLSLFWYCMIVVVLRWEIFFFSVFPLCWFILIIFIFSI